MHAVRQSSPLVARGVKSLGEARPGQWPRNLQCTALRTAAGTRSPNRKHFYPQPKCCCADGGEQDGRTRLPEHRDRSQRSLTAPEQSCHLRVGSDIRHFKWDSDTECEQL
jgi:hypothetical protein